MNIVLYQPDIPQNTGGFLRLCACMGAALHIIEPCGFVLDDKKLARVAMDYGSQVQITRHTGWQAFTMFISKIADARLILLSTRADKIYTDVAYRGDDFLLFGRESAGVPPEVHEAADLRVTIPMRTGARSLNVVNAASMVVGEARRQQGWK
ncbi:MAG: tRNA (cytidine(34)-2'-O)-methyltransferase [Alphaproteobacteria bacterium]|nr:tRNA (cytidine(34)-2'-O)-methyltransferase [Alphaproteobacteria bacterium]